MPCLPPPPPGPPRPPPPPPSGWCPPAPSPRGGGRRAPPRPFRFRCLGVPRNPSFLLPCRRWTSAWLPAVSGG
ncbi:hypothetical protein CDC12_18870 [Pseudomonas aeruginosa]|nr:hypothetical protein CDC12_18870 [Pseudomonas aeruginosa]